MILPLYLPQFYEQAEEPQAWSRFLEKACKGSDKAANMARYFQIALAAQFGGPRLVLAGSEAEFDEAVRGAFSKTSPFASFQAFLDTLFASGYLSVPIAARDCPFADHKHYADLWGRKIVVPAHQLVHDAALFCWNHWNANDFFILQDAVDDGGATYNSQDAVAAMLLLTITWASNDRYIYKQDSVANADGFVTTSALENGEKMVLDTHLNRLPSIHRLLTRIRTDAYNEVSSHKLGRVLDDAEYLLDLPLRGIKHGEMGNANNSEAEFREFLERIEIIGGERYTGLAAAFDEERKVGEASLPPAATETTN